MQDEESRRTGIGTKRRRRDASPRRNDQNRGNEVGTPHHRGVALWMVVKCGKKKQ